MEATKQESRLFAPVACALFTALIAAGAFFRIPTPLVPMTLQLQLVMLAGILLGKKWASLSVLLYIVLGLCGLPIFAQGGGIAYVLVPSFGYVLGFLPAAYLAGRMTQHRKNPTFWQCYRANLLGVFVIYALGLVYLYCVTRFYAHSYGGLWSLFYTGLLLTLPGDLLFCVVGAMVASRMKRIPMFAQFGKNK